MKLTTPKYLFLFTRLPDYFFRCIESLLASDPGCEAMVVRYPPDKNAGFDFPAVPSLQLIAKDEFKESILNQWKPDLIYVAGWSDQMYNGIVKKWAGSIPVVAGMDNPWKGTLKQRIATWISPVYKKTAANYIWVAGYPQYEFARRLGFAPGQIIDGLYCADISKFTRPAAASRPKPGRRIIFVGRMVDYKRPHKLAAVFAEICKTDPGLSAGWELLLAGSGPLEKEISEKFGHVPQIRQVPFIQPAELVEYYHDSSVFCLPSLNEHWGVVIQEAAAAGLSLILSDTCGAAGTFLINGYNGFSFRSDDMEQLRKQLLKVMQLPEQELEVFGSRSMKLAERINHQTWAAQIKSLLYGKA